MKQTSLSSVSQFSLAFLAVLISAFGVSCAGGSARQIDTHRGTESLPPPPAAYIYNFSVDSKDVVVDTFGPDFITGDEASTSERIREGRKVANALAEQLVTQLAGKGITARRATASTHIPMNALVVKGQFVTVKEGDEMGRVVIGFGTGAESLEARIQVYQMRKDGLKWLSTGEGESHGRSTPGVAGPAAVAAGAGMMVGLVVSSTLNVKSEVFDGSIETSVKNLAEELVENAVKFYKRQGWL